MQSDWCVSVRVCCEFNCNGLYWTGAAVTKQVHRELNPLRTKRILLGKISSYRAVDSLRLGYKNQSVNTV
jgi:hypothetical protein